MSTVADLENKVNSNSGTSAPSSSVESKIRNLDDLAEIIRGLKENGKTVVHCHGVFDLIHMGHVRHFEAAKRQGDVLVVTVTKDEYVNKGPGRPVFNQRLRAEALASLQVIDYVAINEWPTAAPTIRKLRPNYFVKGSEYADRKSDLTGHISEEEQAALEVETRLHFTDEITLSSTKLLNSYFDVLSEEAEDYLRTFRQAFSTDKVIQALRALGSKRVLVVGDTIIDEYHFCDVLGKSSKAHTLNARFQRSESHAGGSLAVANQVASFCDKVHLVTCVGDEDTWHRFITTSLKPNISTKLFVRPDAPTVVKRRFTDVHRLTSLFELTFLNERPLPEKTESQFGAYLERVAEDYDLVIVADFGHGLLGRRSIDTLQKHAPILAVNVQTNSANMGYNPVTKYNRADYVCVHENELRFANHDQFGLLKDLVEQTAKALNAGTLTITQASEGSTIFQPKRGYVHTPIFSTRVVDPLGAGDAFLAVTAPCVAADYPAELIGFIGNCVGGLKVASLGNREVVEPVPLFKFITTLLK
jgi:rfaE bifunctional protein nucleotidyltransferase chain/domain